MNIGLSRRHLDQCGSTNDVALEWAAALNNPAPDGSIVTASYQTSGKGSRGRSWSSTAGESVLVSIVLRPVPVDEVLQLGFCASLSVVQALAAYGLAANVKWPNDVLVAGRKIAGILVDYSASESVAVVGLGLNVCQEDFSIGEYRSPPTSMMIQSKQKHQVESVLNDLLACFSTLEFARRKPGGWDTIRTAWLTSVDRSVSVESAGQLATFVDMTDDGSAVVDIGDGTLQTWTSVSR